MTPRKHPFCAGGCGKPVDIHRPHVLMAITLQLVRSSNGHVDVYATNVLGTWHRDCARTWDPTLDGYVTRERQPQDAAATPRAQDLGKQNIRLRIANEQLREQRAAALDLADEMHDVIHAACHHDGSTWGSVAEYVADRIRRALGADEPSAGATP